MPDYAWLTVAVLATSVATAIGCTAYLVKQVRDVLGDPPTYPEQLHDMPIVPGCEDCRWIGVELDRSALARHLASEHGIVLLDRELANRAQASDR